jgi:predicted nucleotidyltransferase
MSVRLTSKDFFISTNQQKVLRFLAKFSDDEFHEREIARRVGISFGSANKVLNELCSAGILARNRKGKMLFYSFNSGDPILAPFKIFFSIAMLRPLVQKLMRTASRIVLFGSCAKGEDTSGSDVDLFIVSEEPVKSAQIISKFRFARGFGHIKIQPVILSALEMLKSEKTDPEFLSLVREGIVLWEAASHEAGIQGVPE